MKVLIDTSVWSLVLRRKQANDDVPASAIQASAHGAAVQLINQGSVCMLGLIRQELLSGVRNPKQFEHLKTILQALDDEPTFTQDHELAASFYNRCRAAGIAGTAVDLLICAVAHRLDYSILSTDKDFIHYAKVLPIRLHPTLISGHNEPYSHQPQEDTPP